MKKILFFSLLILAACGEDPEIKTTHGSATHDQSDPTALEPCDLDYKWYHDGTQAATPYLVNGYYNGWNWNIILNPQWSSTGQTIYYFPSIDNIQFKMRVVNTGPNTFRYRIDDGSWVTLTAGQAGVTFTRTAWGASPCNNNNAIGPITFTMDVERLTCGSPPHNLNVELRTVSVSNGHNFGVPGGGINGIITGLYSAGNQGTCQI